MAVLAATTVSATSASAITGGPSTPVTLPAINSPMWQTNDAVWALTYHDGVVYAAGDFTTIYAPGTASGSGDTPMARIAAFNASGINAGMPCTAATPCPGIGAWTNPRVNSRVYALSVTPDGSTLYAGGNFTSIKGVARARGAAINLTLPGQPILPFNPNLNNSVRAIANDGTNLYMGGAFTNTGHVRLASYTINATGGALRPGWAPSVDGLVDALMIGPGADSNFVVLGGQFRNVQGVAHSGIAQLNQTTAANGPMSNSIIPGIAGKTRSDVKALATDGTSIFVGAEGTGYGIFDGTASINPATGNPNWRDNCLGATQAIAVIDNALYVGSHSHNCSFLANGGFPQLPYNGDYRSWHHLIAEQVNADATPHSAGQLLNWFPTINNGPVVTDAQYLGPRAMTTDGTSLFVGGQFTKIGGLPQRGLTRFSPSGNGATATASALTATSAAPGSVTLRYISASDQDDATLTYAISRDDVVLATVGPQASPFWQSQDLVYRDTGVPAGPHTYTVLVTDANGLTATSSVVASPAAAPTGGYRSAVLADNPKYYLRLDEPSGSAAVDSSASHANGVYRGSPARSQPGAIGSDTAIGLAPTSGVTVGGVQAPMANYSLEAWIKTDPTNRKGGRILGFSPTTTATSVTSNRTLYMMNSGQLIYSILTSDNSTCHFGETYGFNGSCYVWSKQAYNDGTWHHVVLTQSTTSGMAMYVDGVKVASTTDAHSLNAKGGNGVWQVGVSSLSSAAQKPANGVFPGGVDEFAVYPFVLSPTQIAAHWKAAE